MRVFAFVVMQRRDESPNGCPPTARIKHATPDEKSNISEWVSQQHSSEPRGMRWLLSGPVLPHGPVAD